jgi:hypothetical protein
MIRTVCRGTDFLLGSRELRDDFGIHPVFLPGGPKPYAYSSRRHQIASMANQHGTEDLFARVTIIDKGTSGFPFDSHMTSQG